MTDQQPEEDPIDEFMRHITDHACDQQHCKIAQDLALQALVGYAQQWGFYDTSEKSNE